MDALNGIKNFLQLVNDNYVTILVCLGLVVSIYQKGKSYFSKTTDERLAIAKFQIKEVILKKISDAEDEYAEWNKAGSIKRSKVIKELYEEYPILSKVTDQSALIAYIDYSIDNALVELRKIIKENKKDTEDVAKSE